MIIVSYVLFPPLRTNSFTLVTLISIAFAFAFTAALMLVGPLHTRAERAPSAASSERRAPHVVHGGREWEVHVGVGDAHGPHEPSTPHGAPMCGSAMHVASTAAADADGADEML